MNPVATSMRSPRGALTQGRATEFDGMRYGVGHYAVHLWTLIAAFGLGFLSLFTMKGLGTITLAEPIAAALLPLMVSDRIARREPWFEVLDRPRLFLAVAALVISIVGYVLSDLYWGSPLLMSMKGIARLGVLLTNALSLWMLLDRNPMGWIAYMVGTIAGHVAVTLLYTPLFNDYWKFGFAAPVTFTCLLVCAFLGKRYLFVSSVLLLVLVGAHILFGSRGAALSLLAFTAQRPFAYQKGRRHVAIFLLISASAVAAVLTLNSLSVRQNTSRSDIERATHLRFCLDGILKHPLIGNGTWYTASGYFEHYHEVLYRESSFGKSGGFEFGGPLEISIHAQLLNGWCEGGVLGAVFFFVCLGLTGCDLLFRSVVPNRPADEIRDNFMIECIFALAFNPFSGLSRWPIAFQLWFVLVGRSNQSGTTGMTDFVCDTGRTNFAERAVPALNHNTEVTTCK